MIDWNNVKLDYIKTDKRYTSHYKDGKWDEGALISDEVMHINESACVFQYAQTVFEGLKAYRQKSGDIVLFRPDLNEERFRASCSRLCMPHLRDGQFLEAVNAVVKSNKDFVPPYGVKASLYIRPFMIGSGPVINVVPSKEYEFRVYALPLGSYFDASKSSMKLNLASYDRAAPRGTGAVKAGANYAISFYPLEIAHSAGYNENMYLDAASHTFVEESGGANIIFVDKNGRLIVPKSDTILPSITRRSLVYIAKEYLHVEVEERPVAFKEISDFVECGLCGTAAVLSPVGLVHTENGDVTFADSKNGYGPVLEKLYSTLYGIQKGEIEAPKGWIFKVE